MELVSYIHSTRFKLGHVQTNSSASFSGIDVTGHTETDTLRVSGVSTFSGNINHSDSVSAVFGTGDDLEFS